jgi:hypothetical protein
MNFFVILTLTKVNFDLSLDLIFNEYEDNIILNLKSTKLYQGLIESKGEKAVKEREEFLKNEL